ncbi:hypothetical protein TBR22_A11770 [Luteitalea sp. TBR-22]|nr:hypothetical protein [Luteitalea sp. TBR-22]BCS31973.1 hypothetical protein TBR22_A11770 [Luteitalea sp. TBR-22]
MTREPSVWAFRIGAVVQGLVVGALVLLALTELLSSRLGGHVFRYQGF